MNEAKERHIATGKQKEAGFSLIETLVASLILAMGLLAVTALYPRAMSVIAAGNNRLTAGNLAQKKLEELFEAAASGDLSGKLTPGTHQDQPDPKFTRTWSIVDNHPEKGVHSLSVTVAWDRPDEQRSVTFKSLVAVRRDGI